MLIKVDWISFSIPVDVMEDGTDYDSLNSVSDALDDLHPDMATWLGLQEGVEAGKGRAPYRVSWRSPSGGVVVFTHPAINHALIEVSGRGTDELIANSNLRDCLAAAAHRVTRLDIACDMLTDIRPPAFAERRNVKRFKAQGHIISESGETYYVGARSSSRYARVYRYNPPLERAAFLRAEMVIKGEDAKRTCEAVLSTGLEATASALGDAFGWEHPLWQINATSAELEAYRPDRREGKTLYWLADTIAPLLARLHREGVIDVIEWVGEHVIPKIEE